MLRQMANSVSRRAVLGVASVVLALFLVADGALVSAGRTDSAPAASVFQTMQASALVAVDGGVRFANDMRALYLFAHLDEIVPQAQESGPRLDEALRAKLMLCSESRPVKAPSKANI